MTSSQEAFDLEFLLADVSGFIPVNLCRDDVPVAIVSTAEISPRSRKVKAQNFASSEP